MFFYLGTISTAGDDGAGCTPPVVTGAKFTLPASVVTYKLIPVFAKTFAVASCVADAKS